MVHPECTLWDNESVSNKQMKTKFNLIRDQGNTHEKHNVKITRENGMSEKKSDTTKIVDEDGD